MAKATAKAAAPSVAGSILIRILVIALVAVVDIALSIRTGGEAAPAVVLEPDYATIEVDNNATPMEPTGDEQKAQVSQGGGSVTISFQDNVRYDLATGEVTLFYQNPYASTHDVVVQVILVSGENEYLLGQSGLLQPGYEVTLIPGESDLPSLSAGGYTGKLKLLFYDPDTGERAIVDTDIPTTITVTG